MDKGAKQLGRRMLAIYREADALPQMGEVRKAASCTKGCTACCNNLIYVSLPEAVAMVETQMGNPSRLAALVKSCYEQLPKLVPDRKAYFAKQVPCVFLAPDGACGIYESRPVPCRNYFVVSPAEDCTWTGTEKQVQVVDVGALDVAMLEESARAVRQRTLPILLAPIPVAVLWAVRLLSEGEDSFRRTLETEPDLGILDIRVWTRHALATVDEIQKEHEARNAPVEQQ